MSIITTRAVNVTDVPSLAKLWQDKSVLLQQSDRYFTPLPDGKARWMESASAWAEDDAVAFLCGVADGHPVGYIMGQICAGRPGYAPERLGVIYELAIDMHTYYAGLGRKLVEAILAWFGEREITLINVMVPRLFAAEQAFWRGLGLKQYSDGMWMKL